MAEWKKVVVSGSSAALKEITNDPLVATSTHVTSTRLTGSFSGSFKGDGTDLDLSNNTTVGSVFTAAGISGSFNEASSSFSTRVTDLSNGVFTDLGKATISGSFTEVSASFSTRTTDLETASGSFSTRVTDLSNGVFTELGRATISGSFTEVSASFSTRTTDLETASGSFSTRVTDLSNGVFTDLGKATISGSSADKLPLAGGTMTGDIAMGNNSITGVNDLQVDGNFTVAGTASFNHSKNLSVADKYILLNSGSSAAGDGGIVIQQGTNGIGDIFGFDKDQVRFGITSSFNSETSADFVPDAFMAAVIDSGMNDNADPDTVDARYKKNGNIFIEEGSDNIYIYVENA